MSSLSFLASFTEAFRVCDKPLTNFKKMPPVKPMVLSIKQVKLTKCYNTIQSLPAGQMPQTPVVSLFG